MTEKDIDKKLCEFEVAHKHNWQHLIYNLRKHMDVWNARNVKAPLWDIKHSYLPVLFNIKVAGTTPTQIGQRSMVIKQNMSRTIKEMEREGIIVVEKSEQDRRSESLNLTPEAKDFVLDTHLKLKDLQDDYKKIVGDRNLQIATDVLLKIIAYHESLEAGNDKNSKR